MSKQRYDIIDAVEDAAKVGYSVGVFVCKAFYQVSNIEAIKNGMDAYKLSRFEQRLEYFANEHNKLSKKEKKDFYDDLKSNKQNLNYLYELVESSRTTMYELHARLLARLSVELIKNKGLNYFESTLVANLRTFNDEDIYIIYDFLNENNNEIEEIAWFKVKENSELTSFNKCLLIGLFEKEYEGKMHDLEDITKMNQGYKRCHLNTNCIKFYKILVDVLKYED